MPPPPLAPSWRAGCAKVTDRPHLVRSELIHQGAVFTVRRHYIETRRGVVVRDIVWHPGAVVLVPIIQHQVVLVRQWREPLGELLELPAGTLDPGETPEVCADRECREEIGMRPVRLEPLAAHLAAPGYSTEMLFFFLAQELVADPLPLPEEEGLIVERMDWDLAVEKANSGGFQDTKTALGILLAARRLPAG